MIGVSPRRTFAAEIPAALLGKCSLGTKFARRLIGFEVGAGGTRLAERVCVAGGQPEAGRTFGAVGLSIVDDEEARDKETAQEQHDGHEGGVVLNESPQSGRGGGSGSRRRRFFVICGG